MGGIGASLPWGSARIAVVIRLIPAAKSPALSTTASVCITMNHCAHCPLLHQKQQRQQRQQSELINT